MEVKTNVVLNENIQLTGKGHTDNEVKIDYIPPMGEDKGFMPTELLLVSLSGCAGHCILLILKQMRKTVETFEIAARGNRRDEHPTVFTDIHLEYKLKGPDLDKTSIEKAIKMTKDSLCPIYHMLKDSVNITWEYLIG